MVPILLYRFTNFDLTLTDHGFNIAPFSPALHSIKSGPGSAESDHRMLYLLAQVASGTVTCSRWSNRCSFSLCRSLYPRGLTKTPYTRRWGFSILISSFHVQKLVSVWTRNIQANYSLCASDMPFDGARTRVLELKSSGRSCTSLVHVSVSLRSNALHSRLNYCVS
jgi:hypothetical protein